MHPSTLAKRVQISIFLAFIAFYFYGLGHLPLLGPDEPRYAQVAREMFVRGDWITPTLGGHTWFEKPALLYWLIIPGFKFFGVHEWSARLGPALCGLLTIVAVWSIARSLERPTPNPDWAGLGSFTVLITASCLGMIVFSRGVSFDIVVTSTIAWALSFFLRSELVSDPRKQRRLLIGFYVMLGLSVIAKGLVGIVLPVGVVIFYFGLSREWPTRAVWTSLLWGLPLSVLIAAIWYGPVIFRHGWLFIDEFFVQHHFARYVSNKYHHPQPLYFYPVILLMLSVPWTPFLIHALISTKNWSWRRQDHTNRFLVFLFAWILFPLLFFSISSSKLPGYILPVLPAALLLSGTSFTRLNGRSTFRWPLKLTGGLCVLMGLIGLGYGVRVEHLSIRCALLSTMPFIVAGIFVLFWRREQWLSLVVVAAALLLLVVGLLNCAALPLSQRESTRDLLALATERGYGNLPVLAMHSDDRSAEFYASGRVVYGRDGEVTALDEAPLLVDAVRKRKEKILALIPVADIDLFSGKPGIEVVGDNGKLALLCLY